MGAFLKSPLGRAGMALAGVLAFLSWFAFENQGKGAAKALASIEKANTNAVKKADAVGLKSRNPASSGVRDPNSLD